jgi:hypothetical protein
MTTNISLSCKRLLQAAPADVHRLVLDCVITATHLLRLWTNRPSVLQGSSVAPRLLLAIVLSYVSFPWEGSSEAKVRRHTLTPGKHRACNRGVQQGRATGACNRGVQQGRATGPCNRAVHGSSSPAGLAIVLCHNLSVSIAVCTCEHRRLLFTAAAGCRTAAILAVIAALPCDCPVIAACCAPARCMFCLLHNNFTTCFLQASFAQPSDACMYCCCRIHVSLRCCLCWSSSRPAQS